MEEFSSKATIPKDFEDFESLSGSEELDIDQILSLQDQIIWLFEDMRGYVSEDGFDYLAFDADSDTLRNRLCDIEFNLEANEEYDMKLSQQFLHLRGLFQDMRRTTDKLNRNSRYDSPCYDLLYEIFNLHIKVRMLFSLDGNRDTEIRDSGKLIMLYADMTGTWEYDMRRALDVPFGLRQSFMDKCALVKVLLNSLLSVK